MKSMTMRDWLWVAVTLGGMVYGYGALQTRVFALEEHNPIQMGKDIAEIKTDVKNLRQDFRELKQELRRR
jgi:hypothetical protein